MIVGIAPKENSNAQRLEEWEALGKFWGENGMMPGIYSLYHGNEIRSSVAVKEGVAPSFVQMRQYGAFTTSTEINVVFHP